VTGTTDDLNWDDPRGMKHAKSLEAGKHTVLDVWRRAPTLVTVAASRSC